MKEKENILILSCLSLIMIAYNIFIYYNIKNNRIKKSFKKVNDEIKNDKELKETEKRINEIFNDKIYIEELKHLNELVEKYENKISNIGEQKN